MIRQVEYFETPGKQNTSRCVEIATGLADEGYAHFVIATTGGSTGLAFGRALQDKGVNVVAVTHNVGYSSEPNHDQCSPETRRELELLGVKVFTGTILTRSIESAFMKKHQGIYPTYIVAETLRVIGQGIKVVVETSMEACDAGLIPEGADVVAVAGTGKGADTVVVLKAHPSNRFLDLKVRQILAKPLQ
jgi:uncharacterized protein